MDPHSRSIAEVKKRYVCLKCLCRLTQGGSLSKLGLPVGLCEELERVQDLKEEKPHPFFALHGVLPIDVSYSLRDSTTSAKLSFNFTYLQYKESWCYVPSRSCCKSPVRWASPGYNNSRRNFIRRSLPFILRLKDSLMPET